MGQGYGICANLLSGGVHVPGRDPGFCQSAPCQPNMLNPCSVCAGGCEICYGHPVTSEGTGGRSDRCHIFANTFCLRFFLKRFIFTLLHSTLLFYNNFFWILIMGPNPSPAIEAQHAKPYCAFPPSRRRFILAVVTAAGLLGPLAGAIYLPALPVLEREFHVGATAINATVSVFMVVFAFAVRLRNTRAC